MNMIKNLLFGLLLIASSAYSQQLVLNDLVTDAVNNNPALKSSLHRYEAMKARSEQLGYLSDPKVGVGFFLQPVETRVGAQSTMLSVSQMFPWFGTLGAKEQSAFNRAEASYQQYLDDRNRVVFEVRDVFSKLFAVQQSILAVNQHTDWLKSFKGILLTRYENGSAGLSAVLRIEMEEQGLSNMRESLGEKEFTLRARMNELVGTRIVESLSVQGPLVLPMLEYSQEELFQQAMQANPSLQKYEYLESSWKETERYAAKSGLPSFTLGASYTFINQRDDAVLSDNGKDAIIFPQIGISIPIYRGKYNAMQSAARFEIDAVVAARQAAINKLSAKLAAAMESYNNARRDMELFQTLVELSERTRSITVEEYSNAKSNIDDVIQVERQYIEYKLKLEQARADYYTSVARIDYLTGNRGWNNE
jgi:outer membrane protein, heavy metal efflux system